ncbi:MAG: NAD-dependent epimerase/dehydratase family protein [Gemmatimonadetes bacterium]|nr:NAD-dependent epimerase/dehydratase family protein [Gemmatimonadota bacterium]MBK7716219.1 NAD-dependent epimerase/dehydratase family protein [Gemmatimonadota bacterium]MBK7923716.1 NAD-dependent epimerase/dehydratase family protein [Gemmatimonadota bacterium]MBK9692919.1 NAD-dependent epimerase/dehydratase family protein [Gemmatimonadota bacterium]MBP6668393.1 NAD-dependent epimerase/dehydratase family protein [Gemmatimonadales bacterium]
MTRVLLTGAAGFIGSHLAEHLLRRGDEVVGIDNFDPFYPRAVKERNLATARAMRGFQFQERDLLDTAALGALLTPASVVVHLAAKAGVRPSLEDPAGYVRANIAGTQSLVDAARAAGVTRFVFGSSSSVYGDDTPAPFREDAAAIHPISPYAATKRAGELLLEALAPHAGLRVASLRFFTVYGPRQRPDLAIHKFTGRLARGEAITMFGEGTEARDYTYIDDIVAGVLAAVDWTATAPVGVEPFNLGGNEAVPLRRMIETIAGALGVTPRIERAPRQPGDVLLTSADLAKSARVLGYHPATPFPEGIRRFVAWYRETNARQ